MSARKRDFFAKEEAFKFESKPFFCFVEHSSDSYIDRDDLFFFAVKSLKNCSGSCSLNCGLIFDFFNF